MLEGIRVVEIEGSPSLAYCSRLFAAAGASVVVARYEGGPVPGSRGVFVDGKTVIDYGDSQSLVAALGPRLVSADIVLGPPEAPWLEVERRSTRAVRIVGPDWESDGRSLPDSHIRAVQWGTAMAVAGLAEVRGGDPSRSRGLLDLLSDGSIMPYPAERDAFLAEPTSLDGHGLLNAPWPGIKIMQARDGGVVSGPSALPATIVLNLLGATGCKERNAADDHLRRWVSARTRSVVFRTLQEWRTYFTPVLTRDEAAVFRCLEAAAGPGPAIWKVNTAA